MAVAGSLTYDTKLDTKGFKEGLNKVGSVAKGVAVGVGASITAIGAGLTAMIKQSIDSYAEYEQLLGGVESMFGGIEKGAEQINNVISKANGAWKDLTMSQNDYYNTFNSTYPLMKNDIEDQNEAIEKTNRLMTLESDLANTFGYSVEQASTAINWALKGSFNYIDNLNLGIKGTQEGFLEAANSVGYMVDDISELSSSDILDILEKVADQYGVLGKTATEARTTIQGSTKMMRAAWSNLLNGIADDNADFEKLVDDFVDSISAMFDNLIPRILTAIKGIGKLMPKLTKILMSHLSEIIDTGQNILNALLQGIVENIPQMASTITQVILSLVDFIIQNLPTILQAGITILLELIKGITQALPDLIPMMVKVIMDMVNILLDNIDLIIECGIQLLVALAEGIMNALPELMSRLPEIIIKLTTKLIELAPQLWSASLRIIMALIEGMIKYIPEMISRIPQILKSIVNAFTQGVKDFVNIGENLLKGIWNGISNTKEWLVNKIKGIGEAITGTFKKIFGIKSPSKLFREEIGKNLILGVGVAFEKDDDLIDKQINDFGDDVYKKMQGAVNMETGKMAFSGTTGSVSQILSSNATFDGNFVVKAEVQEGTLFEANQRITKEKRLQTGFGG